MAKTLHNYLDELKPLKLGQVPRYVINYLRHTNYKWQLDVAGNIIIKKGNPTRGVAAHMDFIEGYAYTQPSYRYYGNEYNHSSTTDYNYNSYNQTKCSCGHYKVSHSDKGCYFTKCECKGFAVEIFNEICSCNHPRTSHSPTCIYLHCDCLSFENSTDKEVYKCVCGHDKEMHHFHDIECSLQDCQCKEFKPEYKDFKPVDYNCTCGHHKVSHMHDNGNCLHQGCACTKFTGLLTAANTKNKCKNCYHDKADHTNVCIKPTCNCRRFCGENESPDDICECGHKSNRHGSLCFETGCFCKTFVKITPAKIKEIAQRELLVGADDKVGVGICLALLHEFDNLMVILTEDEESGCKGANALNLDILKNLEMIIEFDRRTAADIVTSISGRLCSVEFETAVMSLASYTKRVVANGAPTDVGTFRTRNLKANMLNISCGYYEPHTQQCYILRHEVVNTFNLGKKLLTELPKGLPVWEETITVISTTTNPVITEGSAKEDTKLLDTGQINNSTLTESDCLPSEVMALTQDPFFQRGGKQLLRAIKIVYAKIAKIFLTVLKNSKYI